MMNKLKKAFGSLAKKEEGQALSEYALIIFFVAIFAIAALTVLGNSLSDLLNNIAGAL